MDKDLRARFGKQWSFPASIHAIGNERGDPPTEASSKTTVMASKYTTISGICAGETFCKKNKIK